MSKSNAFEGDLLGLYFNADPIANIAINATSSPLTSLYVTLHTADPGETGNQSTSECNYGSYARVAVARNSGGWTRTSSSVSPTAEISFPQCTSGSNTATYAGIGRASSSTTQIDYSGALASSIVISTGVTPILTTASTITED